MRRVAWPTATLGDLVTVDRRVESPNAYGDRIVDHYSLPAFDHGRSPARGAAVGIKSAKLRLVRPVILVSRLNPHIPRVWLARPDEDVPALASTEFAALAPREMTVEYLYAACLSASFTKELATRVNGTSTSHQRVKPDDLLSMQIPLPPRGDQERIGEAIAALERRRVVSERMAALSDHMLRELFRRSFPSVFDGDSRLGSMTEVTTGVSYRSADLGGDEQALVTLKCFGRDGSYRESGLKPWRGEAKAGQWVDEGDIVIAHTDLTQAAEVLGRAVVVRRSSRFKRLAASLDAAVVRPGPGVTREFLLGLSRQPEFRRYCQTHANGTTVLHLSRRAVPDFMLRVPSDEDMLRYSQVAQPMLNRHLLADEERLSLERIQKNFLENFFG